MHGSQPTTLSEARIVGMRFWYLGGTILVDICNFKLSSAVLVINVNSVTLHVFGFDWPFVAHGPMCE